MDEADNLPEDVIAAIIAGLVAQLAKAVDDMCFEQLVWKHEGRALRTHLLYARLEPHGA